MIIKEALNYLKPLIIFLKIWFTIVILFSISYWFFSEEHMHPESLFSIAGLTFIFSLPLAVVLLVLILFFATLSKVNPFFKAMIFFLTAFIGITLYCKGLEPDIELGFIFRNMFFSVFGSLLIYLPSIFKLGSIKKENSNTYQTNS